MNKIKNLIKELGYKQTAEGVFEKGNKVIYLRTKTFKKEKEMTFQERTKQMYEN